MRWQYLRELNVRQFYIFTKRTQNELCEAPHFCQPWLVLDAGRQAGRQGAGQAGPGLHFQLGGGLHSSQVSQHRPSLSPLLHWFSHQVNTSPPSFSPDLRTTIQLTFSTITKFLIVEMGGLTFDLDKCPKLLTTQPTPPSPANICLLHKFWFWLSNDIFVIFQIFWTLPKLTTAPISPTPNQPNQSWHAILKLQQQALNIGPQGRWELGLGCNLQFQSWLSSVACFHIYKNALFQLNKEGPEFRFSREPIIIANDSKESSFKTCCI